MILVLMKYVQNDSFLPVFELVPVEKNTLSVYAICIYMFLCNIHGAACNAWQYSVLYIYISVLYKYVY